MTRLVIGVRKARLSLGILIFGVLSLEPAHAQTDSAAARALFAEGRELMEKERFEEACPKLEESLRLDEGMGTQFNLAHCWEKVGRTASAWALFLDVAAGARASNQPQRETAARERAKALEPKLTRIRIEVPHPAPNTKVERDDKEVGRAAWGTAMPIDPGDHVIHVTAPGKRPWSHEVKVPAASRTFSVSVPELEDEPLASEATAAPGTEAKTERSTADLDTTRNEGSNGQVTTAWVVGGVGVAALIAGTIFAVQSRNDNSEALKLCRVPTENGDRCTGLEEQAKHKALVDDAKREQTISFIGFGVGGAAVIAATILYVTADGTDEDPASRAGVDRGLRASRAVQVSPLLGADGWGAVVSGHF